MPEHWVFWRDVYGRDHIDPDLPATSEEVDSWEYVDENYAREIEHVLAQEFHEWLEPEFTATECREWGLVPPDLSWSISEWQSEPIRVTDWVPVRTRPVRPNNYSWLANYPTGTTTTAASNVYRATDTTGTSTTGTWTVNVNVENFQRAMNEFRTTWEGITTRLREEQWDEVDDRDYVTVGGTRIQVLQIDERARRYLTPNGWVTEAALYAGFTSNEAYQADLDRREREEAERERLAREERARRLEEHEQRQREIQENREQANARALELLELFLDSEQLVCLRENSYIEVEAEGNVFRIHPKRTSNVYCVSGPLEGRYFCIHPGEHLPMHDQMLLQKTMLEADYREFMRVANY